MRKDIKLVITRVYKTSLENIDLFLILPLFLLNLEDSELLRLLHKLDGSVHSLKKNVKIFFILFTFQELNLLELTSSIPIPSYPKLLTVCTIIILGNVRFWCPIPYNIRGRHSISRGMSYWRRRSWTFNITSVNPYRVSLNFVYIYSSEFFCECG